MRHYLFAYGTLLSGALDPRIAVVLRQHCRIGEAAAVAGRLVDLGAYPGALKPVSGDQHIRGRLIELLHPAVALPVLDDYEDYRPDRPLQSLYRRELTVAGLDGGGSVECWIYWLARPPKRPRVIAGGDWLTWIAQPSQARKIGR